MVHDVSVCGGEDLLEEHADDDRDGGFGWKVGGGDDCAGADVSHAS